MGRSPIEKIGRNAQINIIVKRQLNSKLPGRIDVSHKEKHRTDLDAKHMTYGRGERGTHP